VKEEGRVRVFVGGGTGWEERGGRRLGFWGGG